MVFITLDELIPTAREYGHEHFTALGIIIGSMFVFVLSGVFGVKPDKTSVGKNIQFPTGMPRYPSPRPTLRTAIFI